MTRPTDVATFSPTVHASTVAAMRGRREEVHHKGRRVFEETGRLDPLVDINGQIRKSRFVWTPKDGTFTLKDGYKRPYLIATDGTGSFGENVGRAFDAAPIIHAMLAGNCAGNHQMDFSFGVFQDRDDRHPVIQIPQFEGDNRWADHMRLLIPDKQGGDLPEDYDLGIWYAAYRVYADIFRYGGKGIFVLLLDAPGRGIVEGSLVREHLGVDLQSNIQTATVWKQLQTKFHSYVVVFGSREVTNWWLSIAEQGSVIVAPSSALFAEVQSGLVYATDTIRPTEAGLYDFLRAGGANTGISRNDAARIWEAYVAAEVPFGANAKLGIELPKPGDVFASMTDMWPIGHPRAGENATAPPSDMGEEFSIIPARAATSPARTSIDWSRF